MEGIIENTEIPVNSEEAAEVEKLSELVRHAGHNLETRNQGPTEIKSLVSSWGQSYNFYDSILEFPAIYNTELAKWNPSQSNLSLWF